jgi:hypothetical protein
LGIAAAVLYCLLMPLWEGWDEPYHYGIVQAVGMERVLPDTARTVLSQEVAQSILLAPASPAIKRDHPEVTSFSEFRDLPPASRLRLRRALDQLAPALQHRFDTGIINFEAQQAPLAYMLLAIPDRLLQWAPLTWRVLALRLLIALATVLLTAWGMLRLGAALELPEPQLAAAVAFVLLTQSFLATVCRISNDWLAVALAPWVFVHGIALLRKPSARNALRLGLCLAAGLLAKAYFLAFAAPVFAIVALLALRGAMSVRALAAFAVPVLAAAPWYARNVVLYGSLSGAGGGLWNRTTGQVLDAMGRIPWLTALPGFGRQALWSANSNGSAFSAATLNIVLALLAVSAALALRQLWRTRDRAAALFVLSGSIAYMAALAYSVGDHYVMTSGAMRALMAWYCPPLFPLLAPFLFWGLAHAGAAGRWISIALLALWTYVFAVTWLVKLIPLYAGYPYGSSKLSLIVSWYASSWRDAQAMLRATALGPVWSVYLLTCLVTPAAIVVMARIMRRVDGDKRPGSAGRSSPK